MGKEELEIALQAFEQVPGKSAQQNGTGLGLTITNHLVTSMDSQLYFESAPGFGSNIHFCVAFPRTSIAASKVTFAHDQSTSAHKRVSLQAHNESRAIKALVVEDHPASRQIIALQLQALGIEVSVCDNANAALQLIATDHFDLLMTDQSMPGMQGSELAKQVRSLGHHKLIIIGITADIYALDSRHEFLAAGMNGVLIKPLSILTLENELSRYFTVEDENEIKEEEYSFDVFANLLRQNPKQIIVILDEIKRVHDDSLEILKTEAVDEATFMGILHKIKGGAQLLSAKYFIESCESLEKAGAISDRVSLCIDLLEAQNRIIERYKAQYAISE
jgi:two-component system sensor histidine kinase EvgS